MNFSNFWKIINKDAAKYIMDLRGPPNITFGTALFRYIPLSILQYWRFTIEILINTGHWTSSAKKTRVYSRIQSTHSDVAKAAFIHDRVTGFPSVQLPTTMLTLPRTTLYVYILFYSQNTMEIGYVRALMVLVHIFCVLTALLVKDIITIFY